MVHLCVWARGGWESQRGARDTLSGNNVQNGGGCARSRDRRCIAHIRKEALPDPKYVLRTSVTIIAAGTNFHFRGEGNRQQTPDSCTLSVGSAVLTPSNERVHKVDALCRG